MKDAKLQAKLDMLKVLANKMFEMEMNEYKNGEGEKPEPMPKKMAQSKMEMSKNNKAMPKMSGKVKDMVKGFFQEKKEEAMEGEKPIMVGYVKRSVSMDEMPQVRRRKRKKVGKKGA